LNQQLDPLKSEARTAMDAVTNCEQLDAWRIKYLGKKSAILAILKSLGALPVEERKVAGSEANKLKNELEALLKEKEASFAGGSARQERDPGEVDITLPGKPVNLGTIHPITRVLYELGEIFSSMGFEIVEGPEVEWDYYNFEALNIPKEHPARDSMQTFWVDSPPSQDGREMLLRTHTSPMQIRVMEKQKPPLRIVVPGRVFRYEATDATHLHMFHQIEGLAIDKGITMADLKGSLYEFSRRFFGPERRVRFRCDFFPFVEPGVEMAVECAVCHGSGCRLCSQSGWIEILGAGMVHPRVLEAGGIDPDEYSGFAFGMGIERIPLLRYGIDDIRLFYSNDLRFLRQF
jgi:phenylalanyl-tRNA synthetase alpha chain